MRILVVYSNRHGSTQHPAAYIAATLKRRGLDVTLEHADAAHRVGQYGAFVIGGATWKSHWLNEATRFVRLHWMVLADRPVWLFSTWTIGGPLESTGNSALQTFAPREFIEFEHSIRPRDSRVFCGSDLRRDSSGFGPQLAERVSRIVPFRRPQGASGVPDRPAIEAWADGIARELAKLAA